MKPHITRREFMESSMPASLALAPVARDSLGTPQSAASSDPRAVSPRRSRRYERVELTILDAWNQPHLEVFAGEFQTLTGATVTFKRLDEIHGWWALETVAQADAASAKPQLDMVLSDCNHTWTLWPRLLPLNDYIKKFDYDMSGFFAPVYRGGEAVRSGVRYGLPNRVRAPMVLYRKDLIGALPSSWDEYDKALAAATAGEVYGLSVVGASYPYHPYGLAEELTKAFLARYWSFGDPVLSPDRKPLIAGEKGVAALELLNKQVRSYASPQSWKWDGNAAIDAFLQGRAAMIECVPAPALLRRLEDPRNSRVAGKWAIGPYPGAGGSFFTMQELRVFKHSKHPEAAFEFIAYSTNPANAARAFADHAETAARKTPWLDSPLAPRAQNRNMVDAFDRGIVFAAGEPQWLDMLIALWEATEFCVKGYLTSAQALRLAAAKWTELLKRTPPTL